MASHFFFCYNMSVMKNISKKKVEKPDKKALIILLAELVLMIFFVAALSSYMGIALAACVSAILYLFFYLAFKNWPGFRDKEIKIICNSIILALTFGYLVMLFFNLQMKNVETMNRLFFFAASAAVLFIPCYRICVWMKERNGKSTGEKTADGAAGIYRYLSLVLFVLYFVIMIDFPTELFLNNTSEFSYTLKDELFSQLMPVPFLLLVIFLLSLLPAKIAEIVFCIVAGLNVCIYIQYMFFNRHVGQIFGATYDWKENFAFSILSMTAWAIVTAAVIVVKRFLKKQANLYILAGAGVVFVLLFVSFTATLFKAPKEAFQYETYYVSGKEQFTIGRKNNTILFVIDAVDNSYIKEILAKHPEVFDEYNDFTLYTDTCSVYDLTSHSVPQMILGYTYQEGKNPRGVPFLKRFRDNGYRILFFNVYAGMETEYVDNYELVSDRDDLIEVDYKMIRNDMTRLAIFQGLPCVFKNVAAVEELSFSNYVQFGKDDYEMIGNNNLFEEHLRLTYNENSDNCFCYIHLEGAHFPCEDLVGETEYCLKVFEEYMHQLKELGVYDDAAIIVCADHGRHDDDGELPYPSAATPMFMVKKAGEKHDTMQITSAPMYFMDMQSTMLVASGLFNPATDYDLFGKSVFDYREGDVRTRTWFDTDFHEEGIIKVTYTGDTSELERVIRDGEYEHVDSWEFNYREE